MKRSYFFLIIGILNGVLGLFLAVSPESAAEGFGITASVHTLSLLRSMGTLLFSIGVLNVLVRNEGDSGALFAILIFDLVGSGLGVAFGIADIAQGNLEFAKVAPGLVVPLIGTIGSFYYMMAMKRGVK